MIELSLPYPFELAFMQRALVASVAVGVFAPMIGTFLVQRRMSLMGDGIGHVAFAGVGAGLLASVWPVWTALLFALGGSLGIEWLRSRRKASGDLALALVLYSGVAAGVVLASLGGGYNARLLGYLLGQPLTVSREEVAVIVGLGSAIALMVVALRRVLFAVVTDEGWARVAGLPVAGVNAVLAVMVAFAVVAAMQIVGILLVAAMMVLPVAGAQLLARSFRGTMRLAVAIGVTCSIGGLAAARTWDLAPGGMIVLLTAGTFMVLAVFARGLSERAPGFSAPEPLADEPRLRGARR
jgi:zinc transport system permease protein